MNVKKAIKKVVALGAGLTMIGATIMGATALDLSDYPQPFVQNGLFSGKIVVGTNAKTADVLGAIDIAAKLQGDAKAPVEVGSSTSSVVTGGVAIQDANDMFTWGDNLASFNNNKYDEGDFPDLLAEGKVVDKKGTNKAEEWDYEQYIEFGTYALGFDRSGFDSDYDDPIVALDFSGASSTAPLMRFIVALKGSDKIDAVDLDDSETIEMFGKVYTWDASNTATGELTLWASKSTTYVEMGTPQTIEVDGVEYEVEVLGGNSDSTPANAIIKVNGEVDTVEEGSSYTFGDLELYVENLVVNNIGGQSVAVNLFVGSDEWTLPAAAAAATPTNLEVNGDTVDGIYVNVTGDSNDNITKIAFLVDPSDMLYDGIADEYYDWLALGDSFEVPHLGFKLDFAGVAPALASEGKSKVELKRSGDGYDLMFTNEDGDSFDLEVVTAANTTHITHPFQTSAGKGYGGAVAAAVNISRDQTFFVDGTGSEPVTYVYQVVGFVTQSSTDFVRIKNLANNEIKNYELNDELPGTSATIDLLSKTYEKISLSAATKNYVTADGGLRVTFSGVATANATATISFTEDVWGNNVDDTTAETFTVTVDNDADEDIKLMSAAYTTITAVNDRLDKVEYGMTPYGTWAELEIDNNGDYMNVYYGTAEANYNLGFGPTGKVMVTSTTTDGGNAYVVNDLGVGVGVLDSNVDLGDANLIVVGGPCVNTIAAELMGNPANCAEGFEEGKAIIKFFAAHNAVLVAGQSAQDTQGACKVLAMYDDPEYALSGTEVEVLVPSLSDLSVSPVQ